ncbi:phenazine biosynthesis protein PhzF family [Thalassoporum mexicanum PCC 7367]|uniref:PhzF family phenazine biosynthesis protein n=1 Tax=Thalassoporum mexicanum TaxID=3457544 RepID=UPI00029FEC0A|nr:PhzF family phenazine biosynthesis protein [Pseudanabaena sp. PCC 7367]AFY70591.1 phenazine biosynthesis protein PhzF family [Pseudanabaena sp. PCC 7367]
MQLQIFTIDAFSDRPFGGNPAATVMVAKFPPDGLMQRIAAEMNLSETAFACQLDANKFHLRWFTPTQEMPLCGHATLAMAHYLREIGAVAIDQPLTFKTLSGDLIINFMGKTIEMDFPAQGLQPIADVAEQALEAIFADLDYECIGFGGDNYTVVLDAEALVKDFQPDFEAIAKLDTGRLIITAAAADRPYDFVSRFFAPGVGINEDPVTGSAHCILTPYWAKRLGKSELKARQLSARSGDLIVTHRGDRVKIAGNAITVLRGQIDLPD